MAIKVFDRVINNNNKSSLWMEDGLDIKNMEKFVFKKDVKITNNFVWEF